LRGGDRCRLEPAAPGLTRAQPRARGSAVPMDLRLDASSTNLFSLHLEAARRNTWKSQPLRQGAAGSGATGCVLRRAAKPICDTDETDTSVRVQSLARKSQNGSLPMHKFLFAITRTHSTLSDRSYDVRSTAAWNSEIAIPVIDDSQRSGSGLNAATHATD